MENRMENMHTDIKEKRVNNFLQINGEFQLP